MGRAIVAVVAGYATMFVLVFVCFSAAYLALGADGAFRPGTYDVSTTWLAVWFVVSLVAAVAGGYTCATIAKQPKPVNALAVVVLALGLVSAIPVLAAQPITEPAARTAAVGNMEAMRKARQPVWVALLTPLVGAAGVFLGGRMRVKVT